MAVKKLLKIMSKIVTIANATAADANTAANFEPDKDYPWIVGVRAWILVAINGGTYVLLSIQKSGNDIIQPTHNDGWIFSTAVPENGRWRKVNIKNNGEIIKCIVNNPIVAGGEYKIMFEFLLADSPEAIAQVDELNG
jgi:hypothetical protein